MAGKRGYRAPGNYDPRRATGGKKKKYGAARDQQQSGDSARQQGQPGQKHTQHSQARDQRAPQQPAEKALPSLNTLPASLEAKITRPEDVAGLSWADLGLGGNIVRALGELGAEKPFAIQAATIPDVLAGHHLLGRARTGSGKTIAFGAALVERMMKLRAEGAFGNEKPKQQLKRGERAERPVKQAVRAPKALILAPTRELALQIDRTVQPIARAVGLYTGQFVGGQPFEPQLHALKRGVDIAIGTPGRIEDLAKRGHLSLGQIAVTVIDEADHMAELGFIEQVRVILRQTRRGGQRLLFSATLDRGVDGLVREFMPKPAVHEIAGEGGTGGDEVADWKPQPNVSHRVCIVMYEHKEAALVQLVREGGVFEGGPRGGSRAGGRGGRGAATRAIVFCRTRAYTEMVTELLTGAGVNAIALHGDLSQARRERNLEKFTAGKADVLVATDVAARGIHVDDIELVLQADPPNDPKAYVHRAGRTGRVGRAGSVVTVIPRTRQKRTRELFETLGFEPDSFEDYIPAV